ncbi:MAG: hypothetical protein ACRENP_26925 [Longimicrobiales bacterium]
MHGQLRLILTQRRLELFRIGGQQRGIERQIIALAQDEVVAQGTTQLMQGDRKQVPGALGIRFRPEQSNQLVTALRAVRRQCKTRQQGKPTLLRGAPGHGAVGCGQGDAAH